jgi:hypothetical protein
MYVLFSFMIIRHENTAFLLHSKIKYQLNYTNRNIIALKSRRKFTVEFSSESPLGHKRVNRVDWTMYEMSPFRLEILYDS